MGEEMSRNNSEDEEITVRIVEFKPVYPRVMNILPELPERQE